jgi:flagellar biosynthesis/type III secretory pathway ATPase
LASKGHYPPIDVLESVSRLANRLTSAEHRRGALQIREALAAFRNAEDLIQLGAYTSGANPQLDAAVRELQSIEQFLKQSPGESSGLERTVETMMAIARRLAA